MYKYNDAVSRNIGWITDDEQSLLATKKVAIAGLGGVGGEHLITLLRLGITQFAISDYDDFEVHNFNRQAGAYVSTIDKPKCEVMEKVALDINPEASIQTFDQGINESNVDAFLDGVDVYVDSLDFFALSARRLVFQKCEDKGIPVVTAAPLGMGAALLVFTPDSMSFEDYFRFNDAKDENEALIKFLVGLSPAMLQRNYLVDASKADFMAKKGPSTAMAVKMCAGFAGTEVVKLLTNRGKLVQAPFGLHYDGYNNKSKITWRPWGNNNPIQKIAFSIAKKVVLKDMPVATESSQTLPETPIYKVLDYARWAPSGDNTQVWQFEIVNNHECIVHGYDTSDWVVYDLEGHASQLAIGGMLETLDLAATQFGFKTQIELISQQPPKNGKRGEYKFSVKLEETPEVSNKLDTKLFHVIKRRTVQRKPMGTRILTMQEKQFLESCLPAGVTVIWKETKADKRELAALLFGNGYTRLSMKEGFDVHSKIIEFTPKSSDTSVSQQRNNERSEDKLPAKSLGVDPLTVLMTKHSLKSWPVLAFLTKYLGGSLLPRFLMDYLPAVKSATLFALVSDKPLTTTEEHVNFGRAMQRFWLASAALDLGFQPTQTPVIFSEYLRRGVTFTDEQATNQNAAKMDEKLKGIFGADTVERIGFMGRLGRTEQPDYRSVRKPLSDLIKIP